VQWALAASEAAQREEERAAAKRRAEDSSCGRGGGGNHNTIVEVAEAASEGDGTAKLTKEEIRAQKQRESRVLAAVQVRFFRRTF
jgi:hypothetical protein